MADEPSWDDIFSPRPEAGAEPQPTRQARTSSSPAPGSQAPGGGQLDASFPGYTHPTALAAASAPDPSAAGAQPQSRREAREAQGHVTSNRGRGGAATGTNPPKKRGKGWVVALVITVVVLGGLGGAGYFAWSNYETQIRALLGWELPTDYEGSGNGKEVIVVIQEGDEFTAGQFQSGIRRP